MRRVLVRATGGLGAAVLDSNTQYAFLIRMQVTAEGAAAVRSYQRRCHAATPSPAPTSLGTDPRMASSAAAVSSTWCNAMLNTIVYNRDDVCWSSWPWGLHHAWSSARVGVGRSPTSGAAGLGMLRRKADCRTIKLRSKQPHPRSGTYGQHAVQTDDTACKFHQKFEFYCALNSTQANISQIFARFTRLANFEIIFAKSWSRPTSAPQNAKNPFIPGKYFRNSRNSI
jgi:hypothetical protein